MQSRAESPVPQLSASAARVVEKRYLIRNESGEPTEDLGGMFRRVASNISLAELRYSDSEANRKRWEESFYAVMNRQEFIPNSPTLMNAGTPIQQLSACFVLPVEDSMEGIFDSIKNTALIHKSGGGTGFSFSRIRPRNDSVNSTRGVSSGPVSFMNVFDAATETVKQGGRRRGANMAMLRVDHPDILDFIGAKEDLSQLTNFNISVAITDRFMEAVDTGADYDLINPRNGEVVDTLSARAVFNLIVDHAWRTGEPGVVFIDRINQQHPTPQLGSIEATNPCGEQPLLPYESCNLGSINLARFVTGEAGSCSIDHIRLREAVHTSVRFLDNIIDMNQYPIDEIRAMTHQTRKIGLGVMGFADMLVLMGIEYDSEEAVATAREVMSSVQQAADDASRELARERGAFPAFAGSRLAENGEAELRNSTRTTIAPTGSISIIAATSSGIEPLFAVAYNRRAVDEQFVEVNPLFERIARAEGFFSDELVARIADEGDIQGIEEIPQRWRRLFRTSHLVSPEWHIRIQAAFQEFTDNAVSKTCNFPNHATRDEVKEAYELAYKTGCKGVTIYRDGSRDAQVLSTGPSISPMASAPASEIDGQVVSKTPKPRPCVIEGATRRMETGCGAMYVTINHDVASAHAPFELFAQLGKAGGCAASQTEAIGRLASLALRAGITPELVAKQLAGVRCPNPAWNKGDKVLSCADGIGQALSRYLDAARAGIPNSAATTTTNDSFLEGAAAPAFADRLAGMCIECGNILEYEGGCSVCRSCGYSKC